MANDDSGLPQDLIWLLDHYKKMIHVSQSYLGVRSRESLFQYCKYLNNNIPLLSYIINSWKAEIFLVMWDKHLSGRWSNHSPDLVLLVFYVLYVISLEHFFRLSTCFVRLYYLKKIYSLKFWGWMGKLLWKFLFTLKIIACISAGESP